MSGTWILATEIQGSLVANPSGETLGFLGKESLKNAPGFTEADWPDLSIPGCDSAILAHYQPR